MVSVLNELKVIENELVPVYETGTGEKVVYGTELHEVLGVKSPYREWSARRFKDCDVLEDEDYTSVEISTVSGGTPKKEHIIKLDTAKEMAMLERNEKGKEVRKYFIAIEKKYKQTAVNMSELSQELQMFFKMGEALAKQELEQKRQAEQLNRIEEKQNLLTETFRKSADREDFKAWCKKCISKITKSPMFGLGLSESEKYSLAWNESYERLNEERPCRLKQRVKTAQGEALQNGATHSKIKEINQLTIIAGDKDLKPVYEMVIKEMVSYYCIS